MMKLSVNLTSNYILDKLSYGQVTVILKFDLHLPIRRCCCVLLLLRIIFLRGKALILPKGFEAYVIFKGLVLVYSMFGA